MCRQGELGLPSLGHGGMIVETCFKMEETMITILFTMVTLRDIKELDGGGERELVGCGLWEVNKLLMCVATQK